MTREREDNRTAGIILGREMDVEVRKSLKNRPGGKINKVVENQRGKDSHLMDWIVLE